jgi:predicted nucleic acid-binding protein
MRIYLDACSLQRPLDDRSQPRINVEAEAILTILRLVESGRLELLTSEALAFEIERIPDQRRKLQARSLLALATQTVALNDAIESHAATLVGGGVKPMDALHVASAAWSGAEYFCTCDDKLLKRLATIANLNLKVASPLQLITEVTP